jgi:hypothetical protein
MSIFDIPKTVNMRAFQLISNIFLQSNIGADKGIAMVETNILVPSVCVIMALVIIAGIAVTVQKHKRY